MANRQVLARDAKRDVKARGLVFAQHRPERLAWLAARPAHAAKYLEAALGTGDPDDLRHALRDVAEAVSAPRKADPVVDLALMLVRFAWFARSERSTEAQLMEVAR